MCCRYQTRKIARQKPENDRAALNRAMVRLRHIRSRRRRSSLGRHLVDDRAASSDATAAGASCPTASAGCQTSSMPASALFFGEFIAAGWLMGLANRLFSVPAPFSFQLQGFLAKTLAFLELNEPSSEGTGRTGPPGKERPMAAENKPLMPKATAVWLVDNTALSFEQIADFCGLHPLEVKGIADEDVAKGIKGQDPVTSGQLSREQIADAEKDPKKRLKMAPPKHKM